MVKEYINIGLKICSIAMIVASAGLWAGAGVDTRPKYRDEQTLVGGTIWSQLIIPIGLLLSKIVGERIHTFVHGYFLVTGVGICVITAVVLIAGEIKAMQKPIRSIESRLNIKIFRYDKIYLSIGILSLLTGALTFAQFLILIT